jgi:transposase
MMDHGGDAMYLRHTTITKNGKTHTYWRLVRSVRTGTKVRQETVLQLGELDDQGRIRAQALAQSFLGVERQPGWFDDATPDQPLAVRLKGVRLERGRRLGDVWLAWQLWRALGLDRKTQELLPRNRESIPWAAMAAILVIARLCEPRSELHIAEAWYRQTALVDLLGIPEAKVNDDRLYRALDQLLPHKKSLEEHIKERLGTLFKLEYDLFLYDITSTYFEGKAARNPKAKRGYSRDQRPDCLQVCIGLVVTREGYPLGYEVFEGNRNDATTVQEIVTTMEQRYGQGQRIWVMDRGMIKPANLEWLAARGCRYIVGTPKGELKTFAEKVTSGVWETVRPGLEVQRLVGTEGQDTFLLCRSAERVVKERAMRQRFERRIEEGLGKIAAACAKRRCKLGVVERRVGRLLALNSRAARLFLVNVSERDDDGSVLTWSKRPVPSDWANQSDGCYVLRTNVADWSGAEIWRAYIQLTDAEAAFRIEKSDLKLRPVWHQRGDRVEAHILVCFLAYVLRKTLEGWSERAGLGQSPGKLLEEFARIQSTDVVLPTTDGREVRLRCVVQPDRAQKILLDHLGLDLPQRLSLPKGVAEM